MVLDFIQIYIFTCIYRTYKQVINSVAKEMVNFFDKASEDSICNDLCVL